MPIGNVYRLLIDTGLQTDRYTYLFQYSAIILYVYKYCVPYS